MNHIKTLAKIMKNIGINRTPFSCAVALVAGTFASPVFAANNSEDNQPAVTDDEIEVISVLGIRGSIKQSLAAKQFASEIIDSISAEDIGQLPDENLAEAMQRITGIQMSRDVSGEGSTIQIRGVSDNNVEINGQTLSGTSGDSRSVNFQDIPSELFKAIEVIKAPTADRIEGSMGGTVNLVTRQPLGIQEDKLLSVSVKAKYSALADEFDPDINLLAGKNWRTSRAGDIGLLLNLGYKEVSTLAEEYANEWRQMSSNQIAPRFGQANHPIDLNSDGVADHNDTYYTPANFQLKANDRHSERQSANLSLQWQPNQDANLFLDATYTRREDSFTGALANIISTGRGRLDPGTAMDNFAFSEHGVLISGVLTGGNPRFGSSPNLQIEERPALKITVGGDIDIELTGANLNLGLQYNHSTGENEQSQAQSNFGFDWNDDGLMNAADQIAFVAFNFNNGQDLPDLQVSAPDSAGGQVLDLTNTTHSNLRVFQINRSALAQKTTDESLQIDATYEFNDGPVSAIKAGIRLSEREFKNKSYRDRNQSRAEKNGVVVNPDGIRVNVTDERITDCILPTPYGNILADSSGSNIPRQWAFANCSGELLAERFNMAPVTEFEEMSNGYTVIEETEAAYLRVDFETAIGEWPFCGNLGMRYVATDTTSSGAFSEQLLENPTLCGQVQELPTGTELTPAQQSACTIIDTRISPITFDGDYDDWLPSLNANLKLSDVMYLRLAGSKVIARPTLAAIRPAASFNFGSFTASRGNPDLEPFRATNWDLSFEWYYAEASLFSLALFSKDIDTSITQNITQERFGCCNFTVNIPQNGEGTDITGYEISLQHAFTSATGWWSHTGVNLNYTATSENGNDRDLEGDVIARQGLSDSSYNLVAYFDDNIFSIRLAYNWRDKFVSRTFGIFSSTLAPAESNVGNLPIYTDARGQLDLSANYQLSEELKMTFSAVNLTETELEQYVKYDEMISRIAAAGTRYTLGISYRF